MRLYLKWSNNDNLFSTRLRGTKMASESGLVTVSRWKSSRMDEPACDCQWFSQKMRACTQPSLPT